MYGRRQGHSQANNALGKCGHATFVGIKARAVAVVYGGVPIVSVLYIPLDVSGASLQRVLVAIIYPTRVCLSTPRNTTRI